MRPAVYDQAVAHWRRSGGRSGIAPVPADIDEGLLAINVARVLGVSALDVSTLPQQWVRDAIISLRVDALTQKRANKAAESKRKRATARKAR